MTVIDYKYIFENQPHQPLQKRATKEPLIAKDPVDFKMVTQINGINYQMKQREKAFAEKRPVKKTNLSQTFITYTDRDHLIDADINKYLEKKKWKTLDTCFKWKYITKYCEEHNLEEDIRKSIKASFLKGELKNIEYCESTDKIIQLF